MILSRLEPVRSRACILEPAGRTTGCAPASSSGASRLPPATTPTEMPASPHRISKSIPTPIASSPDRWQGAGARDRGDGEFGGPGAVPPPPQAAARRPGSSRRPTNRRHRRGDVQTADRPAIDLQHGIRARGAVAILPAIATIVQPREALRRARFTRNATREWDRSGSLDVRESDRRRPRRRSTAASSSRPSRDRSRECHRAA